MARQRGVDRRDGVLAFVIAALAIIHTRIVTKLRNALDDHEREKRRLQSILRVRDAPRAHGDGLF